MVKRRFAVLLFAFGVVAISLVGVAQIEVHMVSYLAQIDAQTGKEKLVATDTVQPGDVIEYMIEATNTTDTAVQGLALVGPVPSPTKLLPAWYQAILDFLAGKGDAPVFCVLTLKDADPQSIIMLVSKLPELSIDGGKTYSQPPVSYVINGETKQATPDMFTHIRWTIDVLDPGEKAEISYRVVVP
jgi:uncharacterized repeat protein (TIGR01451 family)